MRCTSDGGHRRSNIANTRGRVKAWARGQTAECAACTYSTALGASVNIIPDPDPLQWYVGAGGRGEKGKSKDGKDDERVYWLKTNGKHHSDDDARSKVVKGERDSDEEFRKEK
jgi:hypothetical protein